MPLIRVATTGSQTIASAAIARRFAVTQSPNVSDGSSRTTTQLQINNLPNIFVWIEQTGGLAGSTFSPAFAVDDITSAGTPIPRWRNLTTPQLLVINTPQFFNFRVVANMISVNIITPAGAGASTFDVIIGASQ